MHLPETAAALVLFSVSNGTRLPLRRLSTDLSSMSPAIFCPSFEPRETTAANFSSPMDERKWCQIKLMAWYCVKPSCGGNSRVSRRRTRSSSPMTLILSWNSASTNSGMGFDGHLKSTTILCASAERKYLSLCARGQSIIACAQYSPFFSGLSARAFLLGAAAKKSPFIYPTVFPQLPDLREAAKQAVFSTTPLLSIFCLRFLVGWHSS